MIRRIAIIPARGGSKRIHRKNIKIFNGKPIISYPIEIAIKSELFQKIFVSTEDREIAHIAQEFGACTDPLRPIEFSDDYTNLMEVLEYVVKDFERRGERFDEVWLIMPCAPLLILDDLFKASELFSSCTEASKLLCVSKYPAPIEWAYTMSDNKHMKALDPNAYLIRSQDIISKYFDAGSFYIFRRDAILDSKFKENTNFVGYEIPRNRAIDIDDEDDWRLAELAYYFLSGKR